MSLSVVPLLIVTNSLIIELSPICTVVFSPPNFKSCGIDDITAPGNIFTLFPILAPEYIETLFPISSYHQF